MNTHQKHADTCFLTNIESNQQRFKKQSLKQMHAHNRALAYVGIEENKLTKQFKSKAHGHHLLYKRHIKQPPLQTKHIKTNTCAKPRPHIHRHSRKRCLQIYTNQKHTDTTFLTNISPNNSPSQRSTANKRLMMLAFNIGFKNHQRTATPIQ